MTVEKIVLHIKNIIFFRVLVLLVLTGIMVKWNVSISRDVQSANTSLNNTHEANEAVQDKLGVITGIKGDKIYDIYKNYETFVEYGYDLACVERLEFVKRVKDLQSLLSLSGAVEVDILNQVDDSWQPMQSSIRVQTDTVTVKFAVADLGQFSDAMRYIEDILPQYGSVRIAVADMQEFLTPDVIGNLDSSANASPLILCEVIIDLKEVVLL